MWRMCALLFVFGVATGNAEAAAFEPSVDAVCKPGPNGLVLDAKLLQQELNHTKDATSVDLINFLDRHRKRPDLQKGGIDTTDLAISGEKPTESLRLASLLAFLHGDAKTLNLAKCFKASQSRGGNDTAPAGNHGSTPADNAAAPPGFFSLRQNVDDLKYTQGSDQFKSAPAASLSLSNDRISNKYAASVNSALGYVFPSVSVDDSRNFIGQIIPFAAYNQQFVQAATPKASSYAENVGAGITGDILLFEHHDMAFSPKYTESLRNGAELFSETVTYTPSYGVPGVNNAYYIIQDALSFLVTPQLKYVFREVTNTGNDVTFLGPGTYSWYGGRMTIALFGEGILAGFSYNIAYEQYYVDRGAIKQVSDFQTSLNYDLAPNKMASIRLVYERGRNLDTLESVNLFTLGLGMKF